MAEIVAAGVQDKTKKDPKLFRWIKGELYKQPATDPASWKEFQAGTFRQQDGIGINIDRAGRPDNPNNPVDRHERVSEPVHENYRRFLTTHMQGLVDNLNRDPDGFWAILNAPEHAYEKKLIDRLCNQETNEAGKKFTVNSEKLTAFLETPAGLEATTMLLEQQSSYEMFSMGLTMALSPEGFKKMDLRNREYHLGVDEGVIANFIDAYVMPYLEEGIPDVKGRKGARETARGAVIAALTGTTALGGIAGAGAALGLNSLLGLCLPWTLTGAAGAAATPVAVALHEMFKGGLTYDKKMVGAALQSIKNLPPANASTEKEYVRRMYGISVDDFQTTAGGGVELVPGRRHQTTRTVEEIQSQALGKIFTRLMFYESIGVPPKLLDMMPEQFVFRQTSGLPEKLGTKMQQELVEALQVQSGAWAGLNAEQRLVKIRETRANMITKRLERVLREEAIIGENQHAVTDLDKQIAARGGEGRQSQEKQLAEARKAELTAAREALPKLEEYDQIDSKWHSVNDIYKRSLKEYSFLPPFGNDFDAAVYNQTAINSVRINNLRSQIVTERQNLETNIQNDVTTAVTNEDARRVQMINDGYRNVPPITTDEIAKIEAQVRARLSPATELRVKVLEDQIAEVEKQNSGLQQLSTEYLQLRKEIDEAEAKLVAQSPRNLNSMENNYHILTGPVAGAVLDLSLPIDQQMAFVRNPANPYIGLIPADILNDNNKLRDFIMLANIEAKARQADRTVPEYDPAADLVLQNIISTPGATLDLDKLAAYRDDQIDLLLSQPPYNFAPPLNIQNRQTIINVVNARRLSRHKLLVEAKKADLDSQIAALDAVINADYGQDLRFLQGVRTIVGRQGEILGATDHIFDDRAEVFNIRRTRSADTEYTQAERDAKVPVGYLEFMQILFDYRKDADKRDSEFSKYFKVLPPAMLAELINDYFGLGLAGANRRNLTQVFTQMNALVGAGGAVGFRRQDIAESMLDIINYLVDRARALS